MSRTDPSSAASRDPNKVIPDSFYDKPPKRVCSLCGEELPTRPVVTDEDITLHVCEDCDADE